MSKKVGSVEASRAMTEKNSKKLFEKVFFFSFHWFGGSNEPSILLVEDKQ